MKFRILRTWLRDFEDIQAGTMRLDPGAYDDRKTAMEVVRERKSRRYVMQVVEDPRRGGKERAP